VNTRQGFEVMFFIRTKRVAMHGRVLSTHSSQHLQRAMHGRELLAVNSDDIDFHLVFCYRKCIVHGREFPELWDFAEKYGGRIFRRYCFNLWNTM